MSAALCYILTHSDNQSVISHHGNITSSSGTLRRLCFSNVKYSFVSFEGTVRCQPLLLSDVSHSRSQPTVNPSIPDAKSSRRCFICRDHTIQKLYCPPLLPCPSCPSCPILVISNLTQLVDGVVVDRTNSKGSVR